MNGKKRHLSDLQKGRMILDFLKKKNDPFLNRHFYKKFFDEQEHSEKIKVLSEVTEKINKVMMEDNPLMMTQMNSTGMSNKSIVDQLQNYLDKDPETKSLSKNMKNKLLNRMVEHELKKQQNYDEIKPKTQVVKQSKEDVLSVITERHIYNGLFKEDEIKTNLKRLTNELQPDNLVDQSLRK
jgi:hypothetical protein